MDLKRHVFFSEIRTTLPPPAAGIYEHVVDQSVCFGFVGCFDRIGVAASFIPLWPCSLSVVARQGLEEILPLLARVSQLALSAGEEGKMPPPSPAGET